MFSVPHLVVLFIVVLVFFGPHKLPELARGLGKLMAEFRKASNDFKMAFEEEMRNIERQAREAEWKKSQEAAEAKRLAESGVAANSEVAAEPKILPEAMESSATTEPAEPVVAPVSEAVAREPRENHQAADSGAATPVMHDDSAAPAAADSDDTPPALPAHDQRQPA